ncbi:DUF2130 domain-containing protein [Prevotella fusca]|uniref:DUF2130 domain-containing protein n=1 Tax=Prevotella fusca JCM 17724 TaxID=1236517 RepID=A0A0K1NIG3_9BACT|nr:DUF2130 domain-containing protein [Prevotella fusca]AKU68820.1 hypothetical protein ADJ77_03030 [Prevotella fusca JCM 17724]QUB86442.1 DUF2130 domain-containing protein [Prevotella fusca JCM 17724]
MKELICPNCHKAFTVDEADYASIVNQVKNTAFNEEVDRRIAELREQHKAEQALATAKTEQSFQHQLSKKEIEIGAKDAEIERLKSEKENELTKLKSALSAEIEVLKTQLENIAAQKKNELTIALAEKDQQISRLNSTIEQNDSKLQLAIMEERNKAQKEVQAKDTEISQLRSAAELEKREAQLHEASLIQHHENELRMKQEQVDYYKDLKTKMSTKMVGETLEQHCSIEFDQYIRPMMPNAYFDKDNDASDGTKGDFIFRASEDGAEYISIMFEMKNEMDTTATKHKNEDFLKKLDDDRKKKGCEFAVLVSLLEADNELYNTGIVNKSHLYPKMYVIRPQFFVPFINLLVQTSKKSLEYKKQLILAQSKEVDVTNFESKIEDFKSKFGRHYELASKKFNDAIKDIDATITKLQKIREELVGSENYLRLSNQDTDDLTIRKLTYKNPTMKAKFDEARKNNQITME